MFERFKKNDFLKSVSILLSGTIVSQLVNYIFIPILSRLYSVEEMGELSLFLRISGFIIGVATARFEFALPLPKRDDHSYLLYLLSFKIAKISLIVSAVLGLIWMAFEGFNGYNITFLILVLTGSYFSIVINLGTNWSIRKNTFKYISSSRIISSSLSNIFKLIFALLSWKSVGLLLGTVLGYILASITFIKVFRKNRKEFSDSFSIRKQKALMLEYKNFPLINLPHSLTDLGRDVLIALIVVSYFGKEVFGHYSYSLMVLNVPITLVGVSISQVFFNKTSTMINEGKSVYPLVKKMMTLLLMISIIPFTILYFFSEDIFSIVLGEVWRTAGVYSKIMIAYFFFNFLVSPLSQLSFVLNRQKEMFILGLIHSIGQVVLLASIPILVGATEVGFQKTLSVLVVFQSIMMVINIFIYLKYSKIGVKSI